MNDINSSYLSNLKVEDDSLAQFLALHPAGTIFPSKSNSDSTTTHRTNSNSSSESPESSVTTTSDPSPTDLYFPPSTTATFNKARKNTPSASSSTKGTTASTKKNGGGGEKRKSIGTTTALKDRRSSSSEDTSLHRHTHTHDGAVSAGGKGEGSEEEEEGSGGKGKGKATGKTSEKRKQQNRLAQRAFRERKEKHTKELEDRLSVLQKQSDETDEENNSLKELLERLQQENTRLTSSRPGFSFVPGAMQVSNQFGGGFDPAPLLPPPTEVHPAYESSSSEIPSTSASASTPTPITSFSNDFMTGSPLFSPPLSTTTSHSAYFPSTTPSTTAINSPGYDFNSFESFSALAPSSRTPTSLPSPLFSTYRDSNVDTDVVPPDFMNSPVRNSTEFNSARTSHSGKSDSGMGSEQSSTYDENTSLFDALCPEGFKVDVDGLCSEMRAKATVEERAAYDLKKSMADDAKSINALYGI